MFSTLLLGVGCGENVLVGNLQLRSLSDAGTDVAEAIEADAVEVDAGIDLQGLNAAAAREHAKDKSDKNHDNARSEDKGHN